MKKDTLTLIQPDDWHCHFREGDFLHRTVPDTAKCFARAIAMPNTQNPITHLAMAEEYRHQILAALPEGTRFEPLMTLYLRDNTTPAMVKEAKASGLIQAIKLYPAGATTHSSKGIKDISALYPTISAMATEGLPLLIHGESIDPTVDVFDREKHFIHEELSKLLKEFPQLSIVLEHITTKDAVDFVTEGPKTLAATITAHHLHYNRNDLFAGGIQPHKYCLPILKRDTHQKALIKAATSGNPKFFLGTDSAPHTQATKESACGCAGIYTAHCALSLYAEIFEEENTLPKLEGFASFYGADFYGLPRNTSTITLEKHSWTVPATLPFGKEQLVPMKANETVHWRIVGD